MPHRRRIASIAFASFWLALVAAASARAGVIGESMQLGGRAYWIERPPQPFRKPDGAGRLAWTDVRDTDHGAIVAYALAFANRYVRGAGDGALLTQKLPEVAVLQYEAGKTDAP